jgi:hypothetical protein
MFQLGLASFDAGPFSVLTEAITRTLDLNDDGVVK